ncbi:MAG: helicase-related protein, partial [Saprospiraceae bacterium]
LFFSATMPDSIMHLAGTILTDPEKVEVTPVSSTAETIQQGVYFVDQANKYNLLIHVLKDKSITTALVFTRTKHGADKVVKMLTRENIKAQAIHGNKSQNARQNALASFKNNDTRVLVATDIASRGIDIDDLSFVINFEIPNISETYVHRIGRTGRAGASGRAISFCDIDERPYLKDIQKLITMEIPVISEHPYPAANVKEEVSYTPPGRNGSQNKNRNARPQAKTSSSPSRGNHRSSGSSSTAGTTKPKKKWFRPAN